MARKTMPAVRKRRCLSLEPVVVSQEQEKLAPSAAASAPAVVDASSSEVPCAPLPDSPFSQPPPSAHADENEHSAHVNIRRKRKRLHACKQKMEAPHPVEEMCKMLTGRGSSHEGVAVDASYSSDCNVLFGAKKAAISSALMGFLKYLSTQVVNGMSGRHCMNAINGTTATETVGGFREQNLTQSKPLTVSNGLLCSFSPPLGRKKNKQDKIRLPSGPGENQRKPAADIYRRSTRQMSPGELENWIAKHSDQLKKIEEETVLRRKISEKVDEDCLEMGKDDCIEIEVELLEKCGDLLEDKAAANDGHGRTLYVERILKTVSLNRANLGGQDEVVVLFKALRSDGKEIMVDNAYLRRTDPLLLVNFYERKLRVLVVGNSAW